MFKSYNEAKRKYWLQTKAQGKNRFIWRAVLGHILTWFVVVLVVEVFGDHRQSFSVRSSMLPGLIMLPIFLLGGFLNGHWQWKDFEKKYTE